MKSDPLVSILVPAYNAGQTIAETLQSAMEQTWLNTEIIVVDDGSKDETFAMAQRFEGPRVKVTRQENAGAAAARNQALALSQGEFVQWLDADDLLSPIKVSSQVEAARVVNDELVLLSGPWAYFRYRPGKAKFVPTPLWENLAPVEWLTRKWEGNLHMQTATWLTSRRLSELAGPWDTRLLGDDDGEYFFRVISHCREIVFVPESKVYYRIMEGSRLSHIGRSSKKIEAQYLGMRTQIQKLRALQDTPRVRAACVTYLQTWLHNFHPNRPDLVAALQDSAEEMGGKLTLPKSSWKYAWIERVFGFEAAKAVQFKYNGCKSSILRSWDRLMRAVQGVRPSPR